MTRPSWDLYFLGLATHAATRATCPRLAVGAVAVRDKRILSTGYNGTASGEPHCQHDPDTPCTEAIHAEINALDPRFGPYDGATLYLTISPCIRCQQAIIDAGVVRVVYRERYRIFDVSLLKQAGIEIGEQPLAGAHMRTVQLYP